MLWVPSVDYDRTLENRLDWNPKRHCWGTGHLLLFFVRAFIFLYLNTTTEGSCGSLKTMGIVCLDRRKPVPWRVVLHHHGDT